jgi:hypothetical protein
MTNIPQSNRPSILIPTSSNDDDDNDSGGSGLVGRLAASIPSFVARTRIVFGVDNPEDVDSRGRVATVTAAVAAAAVAATAAATSATAVAMAVPVSVVPESLSVLVPVVVVVVAVAAAAAASVSCCILEARPSRTLVCEVRIRRCAEMMWPGGATMKMAVMETVAGTEDDDACRT